MSSPKFCLYANRCINRYMTILFHQEIHRRPFCISRAVVLQTNTLNSIALVSVVTAAVWSWPCTDVCRVTIRIVISVRPPILVMLELNCVSSFDDMNVANVIKSIVYSLCDWFNEIDSTLNNELVFCEWTQARLPLSILCCQCVCKFWSEFSTISNVLTIGSCCADSAMHETEIGRQDAALFPFRLFLIVLTAYVHHSVLARTYLWHLWFTASSINSFSEFLDCNWFMTVY